MIAVNGKTFYLRGKNYAYVMCVGEAEYLQHLYYGAPICNTDAVYLAEKVGRGQDLQVFDGGRDVRTNELWSEYSSYGRGDYHEPSVLLRRKDGALMSRFRYASYKIEKGAPNVQGMPHTRKGDETLTVLLRDDFSSAEIALHYIVSETFDVLVRYAEIRNDGQETICLDKALSFVLDLPDASFDLLRLHGNQTAERIPERARLSHGITRLQSLRGASSHQTNPFAAVCRRDCTETHGECYGVQLLYSGSWCITAEIGNADTVRLQGGINDTAFCWQLGAGEVFTTPQVALCYSADGIGELSRAYSDFLRNCVINPRFVCAERPILINNWEATYFDFSYKKLFPIIDEAAKLGIDTFVLDDGWFGKRNWDDSSLGDWFVNNEKLPQGLTPLIDRCKQNGMKFGLWFEPEMISENSDLYRAHSDWAIGKAGQTPLRGRNQLTLDFTHQEVVDYVFDAVSKILRENEISYVKWDMNRSMSEFYSNALPPHKQGEFAHRYILGVYDLASRLVDAFPHVFFEGCSAGGGRFDAGMLYYFPQIWTSDNTDAYDRARIQWGTSYCYPVSAMSCHVSACPNHQTERMIPFGTRGAIASLGATGYELDVSKLTEEEKQEVKEQIAAYKKVQSLIVGGDLYRLSNPFETDLFCEMIVSKDKSQAYVVGEQLRTKPNGYQKDCFIRLYGLDENKIYTIEESCITVSGAALKYFGVSVPRLNEYESFCWHIEAEKV